MIIPFTQTYIETIKSDLKLNKLPSQTDCQKASVSSASSETWHRLFNDDTEYISTTEPRVFMTMYFKLFSLG